MSLHETDKLLTCKPEDDPLFL